MCSEMFMILDGEPIFLCSDIDFQKKNIIKYGGELANNT